jgi:response regulator of citrate/malate metabolism
MKKVINFLIVDDVDATRELLRGLVQSIVGSRNFKFQLQIFQAASAEQTRKILEKNKIQLAFLDIELPDQSGLEILRFMKDQYPDCKAVMVSGNTSKQNVLAAMQLGILGFISKPFNQVRVEEAILNFVKKSKLS